MKQYRLTDEEMNDLIEASKPVPYMVIGGVEPESPYDRAMRFWRKVGARVGCKPETIRQASTGDTHDFLAEPLKPEPFMDADGA